MTIDGTINKTGILLLCAIVGAVVGWGSSSSLVLIGSMIATLILSLLIVFGPQRAAYLSQPYAFLEGVLLGAISSMYAALYAGIVSKALFLTLGCLAVMLALYRFRIIRVTEQVRSMILAATMAIALTYLVTMILSLFHVDVPMLHEGSLMGIGFSVVVVAVAAFNLLLDFDLIEGNANFFYCNRLFGELFAEIMFEKILVKLNCRLKKILYINIGINHSKN